MANQRHIQFTTGTPESDRIVLARFAGRFDDAIESIGASETYSYPRPFSDPNQFGALLKYALRDVLTHNFAGAMGSSGVFPPLRLPSPGSAFLSYVVRERSYLFDADDPRRDLAEQAAYEFDNLNALSMEAIVSVGSIKFQDGKIIISYRGLGLVFIVFQVLIAIGGIDAGVRTVKDHKDFVADIIPNFTEVMTSIGKSWIGPPTLFEQEDTPPTRIIHQFILMSRERKELTYLEELGLDLEALAREIGFETVDALYNHVDEE